MSTDTQALATSLVDRVRGIGPLAVAYSGGADSALVLAAAVRALGADQVLAVTAVSESLAAGELAPARALADALGVTHLTPRTSELDSPGYRANGPDRCYFCKSEVLGAIAGLARAHGLDQVATGTNADDAVDPFRPGIRAGQERAVHTPLRDTGLSKADVRLISRYWDLPTWDKPATPCLASRIRYGIEVTGHRLARVDRAEIAVRALLADAGVRTIGLRVRDLGESARVEVDPGALAAAIAVPGLARAVADAGFGDARVEIDAFQSGRLNLESVQSPLLIGAAVAGPQVEFGAVGGAVVIGVEAEAGEVAGDGAV
jgi:pyridinium-3,5-biscarboxylic acid mononucleotide sulfurtransferase